MSGEASWFGFRRIQLASVCLALSLAASCGSDQPDATSELPDAPCAGSNALIIGRIEDLGQSCVSIRVSRVVSQGEPIYSSSGSVIFSGNPSRGSTVRGHLDSTYAWQHDFEEGARVALFVQSRGEELTLQLFPLEDDEVRVQWGSRELQLDVDDMTGPDCAENLELQRESSGTEIEDTGTRTTASLGAALCAPR